MERVDATSRDNDNNMIINKQRQHAQSYSTYLTRVSPDKKDAFEKGPVGLTILSVHLGNLSTEGGWGGGVLIYFSAESFCYCPRHETPFRDRPPFLLPME